MTRSRNFFSTIHTVLSSARTAIFTSSQDEKPLHPNIQHIAGFRGFGQSLNLLIHDGRALMSLMNQAADIAEKKIDPNSSEKIPGLCSFLLKPGVYGLYISDPDCFEKIYGDAAPPMDTELGQAGPYNALFLNYNILVLPSRMPVSTPEEKKSSLTNNQNLREKKLLVDIYKLQRKLFNKMGKMVNDNTDQIRFIFNESLAELNLPTIEDEKAAPTKFEIPDLEKFTNYLINNIVSYVFLGVKLSKAEKEKIFDLVARTVPELINIRSLFLQETIVPTKLKAIISESRIFFTEILKKRANQINKPRNLLSEWHKMLDDNQDLVAELKDLHGADAGGLDDVTLFALVLLAAYESTSKLLFATLILAADPKNQRYTDELYQNRMLHGDPIFDNYESPVSSEKLKAFIYEAARKLPSFPFSVSTVRVPIVIKDNITLSPPTRIFSLIRRSQNLPSVYPRGAEFNPDACLLERTWQKNSAHRNNARFSTFGAKHRACPGEASAINEVAIILDLVVRLYSLRWVNYRPDGPLVEDGFTLQYRGEPAVLSLVARQPRLAQEGNPDPILYPELSSCSMM